MKLTKSTLLLVSFLVFVILVQSLETKTQQHEKKRSRGKAPVKPQVGNPLTSYNDIPYPVAAFINTVPSNGCGVLPPYSIGILTANTSNIIAPALPLSIGNGVAASNLYAVDQVRSLFYFPAQNLGNSAIGVATVNLNSYGPEGPFTTSGTFYGSYNYDQSAAGSLGMTYSAYSQSIYFVNLNLTIANHGFDATYSIYSFNTSTAVTTYITSTPLLSNQSVTDDSAYATMVLDEVTQTFYWMGTTGDPNSGGYILTFDIKKNKLDVHQFQPSSPISDCTQWAYDPFSGNVFAICFLPDSMTLNIVDTTPKGKFQITEVGTLLNSGAEIIPSGFTIDYITGPAYLIYYDIDAGSNYAIQFDLNSATVYRATMFDIFDIPSWIAYGEWLGGGYY